MRQIENFTTEALAGSIRADHRPFTRVMARYGLLPPPTSGASVFASTQESVPGVGIVDLVGRVVHRSTIQAEVWVEAKIWAPESGNQLARYQRHLATRGDGVARTLVTVGPKPISAIEGIPWVPWQALRDEINRSSDANPIWREFSAFLEERNVADTSTDPLTAREAASMLDAHSLFRKATRVLTEVNEIAKVRWPSWGWGSKDQIAQLLLGQFQRLARFTISTTPRPVYLVLGYTDLHATGEAHLAVWVETAPKKVELRMSVLKAADDGGLNSSWIRRTDSWQALGKIHRAARIEGVEGAVAWFVGCLDELERSRTVPVGAAIP